MSENVENFAMILDNVSVIFNAVFSQISKNAETFPESVAAIAISVKNVSIGIQ